MSSKKISPALIKKAIVEEALKTKRKQELFEAVKKINSELAALNEVGMAGSFGFAHPGDASKKTKSGFVGDPNIGHVTELAKEMAEALKASPINEEELSEVTKLKDENTKLKEELEALKKNK